MSLESVVDELARVPHSEKPDPLRLHTAYEEAGSDGAKQAFNECMRLVKDQKEKSDVKIGALRVLDAFMDLEGKDMALYVCDHMKFFGQISKASKEVHPKMTKKPAAVILQLFSGQPKFSDIMNLLVAVNEFVDKWGQHYAGASTKSRPSPLGAFQTTRSESFKAGVPLPRFQEDYQYMCKPAEAPSVDALMTKKTSFRGDHPTEYGGLDKGYLHEQLNKFKLRYDDVGPGNISTKNARQSVERELSIWQRRAEDSVEKGDMQAFEQITDELHRAREVLASRPDADDEGGALDMSYLGAPPSNSKASGGTKAKKKGKRSKTPGSTSGSSAFEGFGDPFGAGGGSDPFGAPGGDPFAGAAGGAPSPFGAAGAGGDPFGAAPASAWDTFEQPGGLGSEAFPASETGIAAPTPSFGQGHFVDPMSSPSVPKKAHKERRASRTSQGTRGSHEKAAEAAVDWYGGSAPAPAEAEVADWYGGTPTPQAEYDAGAMDMAPEASDWYGQSPPAEAPGGAPCALAPAIKKKKSHKKDKSRQAVGFGPPDDIGHPPVDDWLGDGGSGAGHSAWQGQSAQYPPHAGDPFDVAPTQQQHHHHHHHHDHQDPFHAAPAFGTSHQPHTPSDPFGFGDPPPASGHHHDHHQHHDPHHQQHHHHDHHAPAGWDSFGAGAPTVPAPDFHQAPPILASEPALPPYEESHLPVAPLSPTDIKVEQQARMIESLETSLREVREEFHRMQERKLQLEQGIDQCQVEMKSLHERGRKAQTELSEQAILLGRAKQRLRATQQRREEIEGEVQTKTYLQRTMRAQVRETEALQEVHDHELVREWQETLGTAPVHRGNVRYGSGAGDGPLGGPVPYAPYSKSSSLGGPPTVHQSDELATAVPASDLSGSESPTATSRSRISTAATTDTEPDYLVRTSAPDWIRTPHLHQAPSAIAARLPPPSPDLVLQSNQMFRDMLRQPQGWFYEDGQIALGITVGKPVMSRPQTSVATLPFELLIANRSRQPLQKVMLHGGPQTPLYGLKGSGLALADVNIEANPVGGQNSQFSGRHGHPLSPGHKIAFRGELKARGPFEAGPLLELSYLLPDDQQCRSRLRLPLSVARFMAPAPQVTPPRFIGLWTSDAYARSEVAFLVPVRSALLEGGAALAHSHLLELHGVFHPVPGVDESPWASTLAALYLERNNHSEVLVRAELGGPGGPLSPFDKRPGKMTDAERTLCRVEVRSTSQLVSRAVAQTLLHLVAAKPESATSSRNVR